MECKDRLVAPSTHLGAFSAESLNEILAQLSIVPDVRVCVGTVVLTTGTFNEIRTRRHFARNQVMGIRTRGVLAASIEESSGERESNEEEG